MQDFLHESIGTLFSDAFSDGEKNRYGKTLGLERVTSTLGAFESPTQEIVLRHRWASKRTKRVKSMFMDQTAFLAERSMALAVPLYLKWTCKDQVMCYRELAMLWVIVPYKSKVLTMPSILQVNVHPVLTHGGISAMLGVPFHGPLARAGSAHPPDSAQCLLYPAWLFSSSLLLCKFPVFSSLSHL